MSFEKRIACWIDTQKKCASITLQTKSTKIRYAANMIYDKKYEKSNIEFYDMDAINCCLSFAPNALVLNLSDDIYAGGCVDVGWLC